MIVIIMGVAGSGKTTIGQELAARLGCGFSDADQSHSPANKAKMTAGIALSDEDRRPWLLAIRSAIAEKQRKGQTHVFACSALKHSYRDLLRNGAENIHFVFLSGSQELLAERLSTRTGHFFGADLLQSQIEILEPPNSSEALVMDIRRTPEEIVEAVIERIGKPVSLASGPSPEKREK